MQTAASTEQPEHEAILFGAGAPVLGTGNPVTCARRSGDPDMTQIAFTRTLCCSACCRSSRFALRLTFLFNLSNPCRRFVYLRFIRRASSNSLFFCPILILLLSLRSSFCFGGFPFCFEVIRGLPLPRYRHHPSSGLGLGWAWAWTWTWTRTWAWTWRWARTPARSASPP